MIMKSRAPFTLLHFEILMIVLVMILGVTAFVIFQENGIVDRIEQSYLEKQENEMLDKANSK